MVIYLVLMSPPGSSDLPESRRAALCFLFGLASNGVYMCPVCYQTGGSLLHCPSTLTGKAGGIFLLHCPWSRLRQTLSGTLPCEARTFLSRSLSFLRQRPFVLLNVPYSSIIPRRCQVPKMTHESSISQTGSNLKAASADKFPDQGIVRNFLTADTQKIIEKFEQPLRLVVLRRITRNTI